MFTHPFSCRWTPRCNFFLNPPPIFPNYRVPLSRDLSFLCPFRYRLKLNGFPIHMLISPPCITVKRPFFSCSHLLTFHLSVFWLSTHDDEPPRHHCLRVPRGGSPIRTRLARKILHFPLTTLHFFFVRSERPYTAVHGPPVFHAGYFTSWV